LPAQPAGKLREVKVTTHDDLRCTVETPSGGWGRRGFVPRSL